MNLNSSLFDRIRTKPQAEPEPAAPDLACDHPGCRAAGVYRAPMGRLREGQYFCFCLEHVRAYNATYNYFNGMTDADVQRFQKAEVVGHRPTWTMGLNRAASGPTASPDPFGMFRARRHRARQEAEKPRRPIAAVRALAVLGLDDNADAESIKARYKDLVKRLHPDANGGDRSCEDRLREIIKAYHVLKDMKLA